MNRRAFLRTLAGVAVAAPVAAIAGPTIARYAHHWPPLASTCSNRAFNSDLTLESLVEALK